QTCALPLVGGGNADFVGHQIKNHAYRGIDISLCFTQISELKKEGHLYTFSSQEPCRLEDLVDTGAFVHRVEDLLRSRFSTHPDSFHAGPDHTFYGGRLEEEVYPRLNLVPEPEVFGFNLGGKLLDPTRLQPENVIAHPKVVRAGEIEQPLDFPNHMVRRPRRIAIAIDGFGAPVTLERTSPRGGNVQRKKTMMPDPNRTV